ncbi:MAG: uridine kinase [Clostridia bacterium]|nr:uridine kinase [Clostridia bacterium]
MERDMRSPMIIGIAGGTGSGKTTITKRIVERFGDKVTVLYHDDYYKEQHSLTYEERCKVNYDHPDAFDNDLFLRDLDTLRSGKQVLSPVYDYTIHDRSDKTKPVRPAQVILVEGILIFADTAMTDRMDIKVFVDTDADVRILRRLARDVKKRGRSIDSVISQYLNTVKPMHEKYVEPSKKMADIIVLEGGRNAVALDLIMNKIDTFLKSF